MPVKLDGKGRIGLEIVLRGDQVDFAYMRGRAAIGRRSSKTADATILSTKTAGGFVGTEIGMYAFTPAF